MIQRSARACLLSGLTSIGTWYVAPPIRFALTYVSFLSMSFTWHVTSLLNIVAVREHRGLDLRYSLNKCVRARLSISCNLQVKYQQSGTLFIYIQPLFLLFRSLSAVFRTSLFPVSNTCSIKCTSDDMVSGTR